ncbi:MAG: hypothetical protein AB7P61_05670 [Gemmatimonadales bacterium]
MNRQAYGALLTLLLACSGDPEPAADPAALAAARADSLARAAAEAAPALRDSAQATLAALLDTPASATFDSVVVIQPPMDGDRLPGMVVCGRIGGRPGIGGSRTPVRFIYQNRWTVFIEEAANRAKFGELWDASCGAGSGTVVRVPPAATFDDDPGR